MSKKTRYEGGYYFLKEDMVRTGIHSHTNAIDNPISEQTIRALNCVQRTPWLINGRILDVVTEAYESGTRLANLPYNDAIPIPSKSDDEWDRMTDEEKLDWRRKLAIIYGSNATMEARRSSFNSKVDLAQELRVQPAIWYPHFLDFRTRFYPIPQDLHPQGDDLSKALLMFAERKPLGMRGLYWLGVRLANCYGQDKLPLDERYQWALDHHDVIVDSARNPLDGYRFWCAQDLEGNTIADEPWGFLATCFEWADAHDLTDPTLYESCLPIQQDGSCNGLQHLSAMGRDPIGAKATNVAANEVRQDIYMQIAAEVMRLVAEDAVAGNPLAHAWVGKITRKVVKRAVMTTPYGVTARGIAEQLIKDGHAKNLEDVNKREAANYLRDKIVLALDTTVVSAKQIMAWLQEVAGSLAKYGVPFTFTTPSGNRVQQSYYELNKQRINTLIGKLVIWEEDKIGGLAERKQMLAAAPNFIHAYDSAHMTLTILRMVELSQTPISFSMIHDSFGVHACDVDLLSWCLRDQFVEIYTHDWLQKLEDEVREYAPQVPIPSYREFVSIGDFDVSECMDSDFFFS
jgi:DNA-directed RNA polymerase